MLAEGQKISVVIITKNEEANIARCIKSCQQVSSDIVVIDAYSSDKTVQIAADFGARVFQKEWEGYGANKNFGNEKAVNEWILSLDADEELDTELIDSINNLVIRKTEAYVINIMTKLDDTWIKHSGWHPLPRIRLFNKSEASWNTSSLHEELCFKMKTKNKRLKGICRHYSFNTIIDFKNKMDRYAHLRAEQWFKNDQKPSILRRVIGPSLRMITVLVLKRGFLDGKKGLLIANEEAKMIRKSINYYDNLKK